jgi:hypothetical protein
MTGPRMLGRLGCLAAGKEDVHPNGGVTTKALVKRVETMGLEPTTPCVQSRFRPLLHLLVY